MAVEVEIVEGKIGSAEYDLRSLEGLTREDLGGPKVLQGEGKEG